MELSVTSWSFPALTLTEVGGLANLLSIPAIDIGLFYASALDKAKILTEPERYGAEIRETLPVKVANYYHLFGAGLNDRNLALPADPENLQGRQGGAKLRQIGGGAVDLCPSGHDQSRAEPPSGAG